MSQTSRSANSPISRATRAVKSVAGPRFTVSKLVLSIYFLLWIVAMGCMAVQTWPDNTLRSRPYDVELARLAILQVTSDEIAAIDHALTIAARLPHVKDDDRLAFADVDFLVTQCVFAQAVLTQSQNGSNTVLSSPDDWNEEKVGDIQALLRDARNTLESRAKQPPFTRYDVKGGALQWLYERLRAMIARSDDPMTSLLSSERAKVSELVASVMRPPKASVTEKPSVPEKSAQVEKLHAMFNGIRNDDFVLLILSLGALGACVHGLASLADYFGTNRFNPRWNLYYIGRPFIGASVALAFYVVFRGGLNTQFTTWEDINHLGYAAIAILVGICSSEAMQNLKEIAAAIFRPKPKTDGLGGPTPIVHKVADEGNRLVIYGSDFSDKFIALENDAISPRKWVRLDQNNIISDSLVPILGGTEFKVVNLGNGGGVSSGVRFVGPLPPQIAQANVEGSELIVTGMNFARWCKIIENGQPSAKSWKVESNSRLSRAIDAAERGTNLTLEVENPGAHPATSAQVAVSI